MALFKRFENEAEFRDKFVRPLLNRLGFYGVEEQDGPQEFGKDFVFSELHRLGGMRHYAAQVKHEETIRQGPGVDGLLSQVRQAFAKPFTRPDSPRPCHVSGVYIFNSGAITPNAKEFLLSELTHERYGDNVHFLDGDRLHALNEWGMLQSDSNARARLLGLRSALRVIIQVLTELTKGEETIMPMFVNGIELYLSEPVNCDDELLSSLFGLWHNLRTIERVREAYPLGSGNAAKVLPKIAEVAQRTQPEAIRICHKIDSAIEKMKPLQ